MRYHVKMDKLLQKVAKVTKVPDDTYGERKREREKTLNPACKVENYDIRDREFNLDVDWVEYCVEWEK